MRGIKKMIVFVLKAIFLLIVIITLFINLNPAFGKNPDAVQKEKFKEYENYVQGKFINEIPTRFVINSFDTEEKNDKNSREADDKNPQLPIITSDFDWKTIKNEKNSMTWLGHSSYLLSIDNKKLLIDPMLSSIVSPVSFIGVKRYEYSEGLNIEDFINNMPIINAVFITHDHYDHLDYQSIVKLDDKAEHFFVPLGIGASLIDWGVSEEKITELNWWDEVEFQGLTAVLTPARHYSGRGIMNRNSTLWGGWAVCGEDVRVFNSGDSGYGPHLKEIGNKYGPFDVTFIDGGQYDRRWPDIHMLPEQSVQANIDLKGKNMMLAHWGSFSLANHSWKEPIDRAVKEAEKQGVNIVYPLLGETLLISEKMEVNKFFWWEIHDK